MNVVVLAEGYLEGGR
jgi:NTE family protein